MAEQEVRSAGFGLHLVQRIGRYVGIVLLLAAWGSHSALPQASGHPSSEQTAAAIVQHLVVRNQQRAEELGAYTSRRHYRLEYRGLPHSAEADMVVDAACDGPSSKRFQIVSSSGSKELINRVLRELLKTEQDAAGNWNGNALTPANYNFTLIGSDTVNGRQTFVLKVEPKEVRALLYRGTIWVDALEYAVVKLEAQPARDPSFWIRDTEIHHFYSKAGDFWLPVQTRSESKMRLGGTALLTISYDDYRFLQVAERSGPSMNHSSNDVAMPAPVPSEQRPD